MTAFKSDLEKIKEIYKKAFELAKKVDVYQGISEDELKLIAINQSIKTFKKYRETTESERVIEFFKEEIMKPPNKSIDYKIFPDLKTDISDAKILEEEYGKKKQNLNDYLTERPSRGCLLYFCLTGFFIYFLAFILYLITKGNIRQVPDAVSALCMIGLLILSYYITKYVGKIFHRKNIRNIQKKIKANLPELKQKIIDEINLQKTEEAEQNTIKALNLYNSALKNAQILPEILNKNSEWINRAEYEFKNNAFDPYWDAMEKATEGLYYFNEITQKISKNRINYYKILQGESHNFPDYPVKFDQIPNPMPYVERYYKTLRLGQTNYEFTDIWRHRKTERVLIEGFKSLGEAIEDLTNTVKMGFSHLELSLKRDFSKYFGGDSFVTDRYDSELTELEKLWQGYEKERYESLT